MRCPSCGYYAMEYDDLYECYYCWDCGYKSK